MSRNPFLNKEAADLFSKIKWTDPNDVYEVNQMLQEAVIKAFSNRNPISGFMEIMPTKDEKASLVVVEVKYGRPTIAATGATSLTGEGTYVAYTLDSDAWENTISYDKDMLDKGLVSAQKITRALNGGMYWKMLNLLWTVLKDVYDGSSYETTITVAAADAKDNFDNVFYTVDQNSGVKGIFGPATAVGKFSSSTFINAYSMAKREEIEKGGYVGVYAGAPVYALRDNKEVYSASAFGSDVAAVYIAPNSDMWARYMLTRPFETTTWYEPKEDKVYFRVKAGFAFGILKPELARRVEWA